MAPREVGNGAGNAEHLGAAARGKAELLHRPAEKAFAELAGLHFLGAVLVPLARRLAGAAHLLGR